MLANQGGRGQLRELQRRSLSECPAELQDAAHNIFAAPALAQRSQILRRERRCPVAEHEKASAKIGLQRPDSVVVDLATERFAKITEALNITSRLNLAQPLMQPLQQQRRKRVGSQHSTGPRGV